jgi:hypothetical protein
MKTKVLSTIATILSLFSFPNINLAQVPNLGSSANFVLFTINGAVTNTGVSKIIGDIGTNSGLITGSGTSSVTGNIHNADIVTAQCSADLLAAYNQLYVTTITSTHTAVLGNNEILNAGVYSIAAAGSLNSILTLDAQGDSNAVFIFKIGAAFTTAASSTVSLVNGASANNVFWIAEGAIAMAASTTMKGTLISHNAAISIGAGSNLVGRMFSTAGDVTLDALSASIFPPPVVVFEQAPNLGSLASFILFTTTGAMGNTGVSTITGNIGDNQGSITGFVPGNLIGNIYNADAATAIGSTDLMNAYNQLISTAATSTHLPVLGNGETLYPGVYSLAAAGSIASVLTLDAQGDPNAVFIFKIGGAFSTAASSTVNLIDGASACNVFWVAEGAISMAASTTMKGTLISHNGAVSIGAEGSLEGRMFSTTGAVSVYSVSAYLPTGCSVATIWTGAAGTSEWYTTANWTRAVPDEFAETLIPTTLLAGRVFPILDSSIAAVDTITIQNGATVTIAHSTLQINGAIINNGTLNAASGTIEMIGFSGQTIAANTFQDDSLYNLIISNSSAGGVTLGGALDIYGSLTYSDTRMKLITNDVLTLKSTALNTARIGDMTGDTITGKVTVERYIPAHKAWQFLSIPTNTTQTIQQSWQEGATSPDSNSVPGYGIQLSGPGGTAAGFDLYSGVPSMKIYNSSTNVWTGISATTNSINSTKGYLVFIRGDRSVTSPFASSTKTVLRTKGGLYTGNQTPIPVNAGELTSIGNPYASYIDMRKITKTGVKDFFYLWDPALAGPDGYGTFQTFSINGSGNYVITPGNGSYGAAGSTSNFISSGLAFIVQGDTTGGSLSFNESVKTDGSVASVPATLPYPKLMGSLYGVNTNGTTYVADGFLVNYQDCFKNAVDDNDAVKLMNPSENLAIKRDNTLLVIERRHSIMQNDTVFLYMSNLKMQQYRFEFTAAQLNNTGLTAVLNDNYLHTNSSINTGGSTVINFNIVNIPGSYATDRFKIMFTQPSTLLPVTFAFVKAYFKSSGVNVEWKVENENNMNKYDVEKSTNGNDYTITNTVIAGNKLSFDYNWLDVHPSEGYNYYRIRSTDVNGKTECSTEVKVFVDKEEQSISVYPNPITNGMIDMRMNNEPGGIYGIQLLNEIGQVIISESIHHAEGTGIETITTPKLAKGTYVLVVINPGNTKISYNIIY